MACDAPEAGREQIRVIDPQWIPLSDGTRLCARVWLPESASWRPVPAILEYLPYRRGDVTALEDSLIHPYFAAGGYAGVRVDIRGSGDSDGILTDEYSEQEHRDALEVIGWLAEQPWCTGAVGMMGISWSGFNSLQVAALRPPALRAIITACSTDDRYDNDVHYLGGVPLGYYLLPWASAMMAFNVRPPDPAIVGDRWRELWHQRLDGNVDLCRAVASPPGPGRLLAPRIDLRGLRGGRVPGAGGRRLGRRVRRRDLPDARAAFLPASRADRSVGPPVAASGRARSPDRLSAGGRTVVGPLAQGRGQRRDGRTDAARVDAGAGLTATR